MELPIIVERVTYQKDNFAILAANLDAYSSRYKSEMEEQIKDALNEKYNTFTVILSNLMTSIDNSAGGQYIVVGDWVNDPKRGKQFKADFYYLDTPSTEDGLRAFLMTLPNIKEARSQSILKSFGITKTIEILDNNPDLLLRINGITKQRLEIIKKEWDEKRYLLKFYEWLLTHGITLGIADKAFRIWGFKSMDILMNNPYKLIELRGIGFVTADRIAHQIVKDIKEENRIKACIHYVLEEEMESNSNICLPYSELKKKVIETVTECDSNLGIKGDIDKYISTVSLCLKNNLDSFSVVKDIEETPNTIYVYMKSIWDKEKYISESIYNRSLNKNKVEKTERTEKINKIIDNFLNSR